MSESAFGVEHGEISKIGMKPMKMNPLGQMKSAFKGVGAKAGAATQKLGGRTNLAGTSRQMGAKGPMGARIGGAQAGVGSAMRTAGNKMAANPGVTGAAIGGGAAGVGGGVAYGNRNRRQ